jgi:hypothetical protein
MEIGLLWAFILFVSLILNVGLVLGIRRALVRTEGYDEFLEAMQNRLKTTIQTMRSIDIRGSFESDDEVGGVFQQMKAMIEALDVFIVTETTDAEEE